VGAVSKSQRTKGLEGEREVAAIFAAAGYSVRNLEGQGDALAIGSNGRLMHVEVKRQERVQILMWLRQAQSEAPKNVPPVVAFRRNHGEWMACLRLDDLLGMLG
jgi:Holliday junction resolvase